MSCNHHDPESDTIPRGRGSLKFRNTAGQNHPAAKITNAQAVWIVKSFAAGVPAVSLAAMTGLTADSVRDVVRGKRFGSATEEARRFLAKIAEDAT